MLVPQILWLRQSGGIEALAPEQEQVPRITAGPSDLWNGERKAPASEAQGGGLRFVGEHLNWPGC